MQFLIVLLTQWRRAMLSRQAAVVRQAVMAMNSKGNSDHAITRLCRQYAVARQKESSSKPMPASIPRAQPQARPINLRNPRHCWAQKPWP